MAWIIKWVIKECSTYLLIWLADWTNYNIIEHTKDLFFFFFKEQLLLLNLINSSFNVIVIGDDIFQRVQIQGILKFL